MPFLLVAALGVGCKELGTSGTGGGGGKTVVTNEGGGAPKGKTSEDLSKQADPTGTGPSGTTSAGSGTGSTGAAGNLGCVLDPAAPDHKVATVSDPSRSYDSAVYARGALHQGLAPDPSVLREDDFLNFYGSPPGYDGAPKDGEVEYVEAQGLVEARFWIAPATSHTARKIVVLVDASVSMKSRFDLERKAVKALADRLDASQGDELVVVAWSSAPTVVFDSSDPKRTSVDAALDAAFSQPGGASDLPRAFDLALPTVLEGAPGLERHILVLTDGGSSAQSVAGWSGRCAGSNVKLDVALLALENELGSDAPAQARSYNQALLTELTQFDGARLLLSGSVGADGVSDVDVLLRDRFEEVFGTAVDSSRATLSFPYFLKFIADAGTGGSGPFLERSVGYGRALTYRVHVAKAPLVDVQSAFALCTPDSLALSASRDPAAPAALGYAGAQPSALGLTRAAIRAYVAALRSPSNERFADVDARLATASAAVCNVGPESAPLCAATKEISQLVALHPAR